MALTAKKVYAILKRQISDMEAKLNSPVRYRGTVATADLLPLNPDIGDMYNIESKSIYGEAGMNVAWNGVVWDTMGAPIDMSLYLTKEEAEAVIQRLVTEYFEKNPVKPGATTEQAQQIEQNKTDIASLKTETGSLKEDLSTKITKFYASNQGETHLADSDNGKIMDMMIYGKSEQKQYSGKNLLNATLQTTTVNGVTCTNNGDGTYTLNGTASGGNPSFRIGKIIAKSGRKLVGSPGAAGSYVSYLPNGTWNNVTEEKGDGSIISNIGKGTDEIAIVVLNGTTVKNLLFKPMLTTDLTATYDDFEPYHEQTVTLPYDLYGVKVPSGGNVTIDGQEYVSDYFDVERGKLVRMVYDVEAKNYEWHLYSATVNTPRRFGMNDTIGLDMPDDTRIMSFHFKQIAYGAGTDLSVWFQRFYIAITDMNEKWENSEALIQWFSENNVHFYLPLKTPIEIDLTPEEVQAFKAFETYYPTTNISINSEQLDGYTVFNYPISMKNGWNYVKKQLNDNRDYIYDMDSRTQDIDTQAAEAYVNSEYAVALTELEV